MDPVPPLVLLALALTLAPPECPGALVATTQGPQQPVLATTTPAEMGRGEEGSEGERRSSSPLRVAQCRARCFQRFSGGLDRDAGCMQGPDCFTCWENCELLHSNYDVWGAMCTQKEICFPGCQQACRFLREVGEEAARGGGEGRQTEPVVHTRVVRVLTPQQGAALVRWPPLSSDAVVYVLMTKEDSAASWTQVAQTVDLEARVGASASAVGRLDIRVLVVGPEGLVAIYGPSAGPEPAAPGPSWAPRREGRWPAIREDVTSPLDDAQLALLFPTASAEDVAKGKRVESSSWSGGAWVLREVSLIHQGVLVIAEVSWEARRGGGVYLVTWEVDGGGLRGNLFTHTTSVALSLWPRTLYHIQVEVASRTPGAPRPPDRSQVLRLDTRRAAPVVLAAEHPQRRHPDEEASQGVLPAGSRGGEVLAGAGAALVLAALLLAAWRWRRGRPCSPPPPATSPSLKGEDGSFLFRSLGEVLAKARGDGEGRRPGMASGGSGESPERWPQHPESYADAFLREAERRARNEVQV